MSHSIKILVFDGDAFNMIDITLVDRVWVIINIFFGGNVTLFFLHFCSDPDEIWQESGPWDPKPAISSVLSKQEPLNHCTTARSRR